MKKFNMSPEPTISTIVHRDERGRSWLIPRLHIRLDLNKLANTPRDLPDGGVEVGNTIFDFSSDIGGTESEEV